MKIIGRIADGSADVYSPGITTGEEKLYSHPSDPIEQVLDYPGARPEGSFITNGDTVAELPDDLEGFKHEADEYLWDAGLPMMEGRIPVLAYGANASPARLRDKMAKFIGNDPEMMQTVPHIAATMPGMLAVWHGEPGQIGSCFAELYSSDDKRAALQAHVAFLTLEQLIAVHTSEGGTYSAAELQAHVGEAGNATVIPAIGYVGLKSSILLKDGKPVLVSGLKNRDTDLPAMTAEEAVQYMLDGAKDEFGPMTARDLVAEGKQLKLAAKKVRQARIRNLLVERGMSQEYMYPVQVGDLIGRADLSSLPGLLDHGVQVMPEMVMGRSFRTEDQKKDPICLLEKRAVEEIEVRRKITMPERVARAYEYRRLGLSYKHALRMAAADMAKVELASLESRQKGSN